MKVETGALVSVRRNYRFVKKYVPLDLTSRLVFFPSPESGSTPESPGKTLVAAPPRFFPSVDPSTPGQEVVKLHTHKQSPAF